MGLRRISRMAETQQDILQLNTQYQHHIYNDMTPCSLLHEEAVLWICIVYLDRLQQARCHPPPRV